MDPWVTIVVAGAAIAGYGWLKPEPKSPEVAANQEAAYDQLLDDLETENRELVDAVAAFKQEQDETVTKLGKRIRDLEKQMAAWEAKPSAVAALPSVAAADAFVAASSSKQDDQQPSIVEFPVAASSQEQASLESIDLEPELPTAPATIRQRYSDLVDLYERGRSVEQVAKAMGMNKGEVQLILQLAKREGEKHG